MNETPKIEYITSRWLWWPTKLLAFALWLFILTKPFFDLDIAILKAFALTSTHLLAFRFWGFLGLVIASLILYGITKIRPAILYIWFFPLIVVFWILPKLLYKNVGALVALSPAIYSIWISLRITLLGYCLVLVSAFAIYKIDSKECLTLSIVYLVLFLIWRYYTNFYRAFDSHNVFAAAAEAIRKGRSKTDSLFDHKQAVKKSDDPSTAQELLLTQRLTNSYLLNIAIEIVSEKIAEATRTKRIDLFFIGSLVWLVLITVICFAFCYMGIEKIAPGSFSSAGVNSIWDYIGYSFSTLMTADVSPLKPLSNLAQWMAHLQLVSTLGLLTILVFVILTVTRERYHEDAELVLSELRENREYLGTLIAKHCGTDLDKLEERVILVNVQIVNVLRKIRGQPEVQLPESTFDDKALSET